MATTERTLERLQYLEALYRQGYRSEVVDRSLEKLLALEKAAARRELAELEERLGDFEVRYQMPSDNGWMQHSKCYGSQTSRISPTMCMWVRKLALSRVRR